MEYLCITGRFNVVVTDIAICLRGLGFDSPAAQIEHDLAICSPALRCGFRTIAVGDGDAGNAIASPICFMCHAASIMWAKIWLLFGTNLEQK